jgi:hypothetical protein
MGNYIYTFFLEAFVAITLSLGLFFLVDIVITSIIFVFSGNFDSFLQRSLEKAVMNGSIQSYTNYLKMNTELQGLDIMVNWFIELQYDVVGRWKMFFISAVVSLTLIVFGAKFGFDIMDNSGIVSALVALAILLPMILGLMLGGLAISMEFYIN